MTQTQGFDPQAIIRKLAEAEWQCPQALKYRGLHDVPMSLEEVKKLSCCKGSGIIVPFASLRVARCIRRGPHRHSAVFYNPSRGKPCNEGWRPEPDVEKACHRIREALGNLDPSEDVVYIYRNVDGWHYDLRGTRIPTGSYSEATLRAAEAWLDTPKMEARVC